MGFRQPLSSLLAQLNDVPPISGFEILVSNLKRHLNHYLALDGMDKSKWRDLCDEIEEIFHQTTHNESPLGIGAYYTPKPIADFICRLAISPYLNKRLDSMNLEITAKNGRLEGLKKGINRDILEEVFFSLKLLDSSVGLGEFLVAAIDYLMPFYEQLLQISNSKDALTTPSERRTAARRLIIEKNLYGVDICPAAISLLKFRLWFIQNKENLPHNSKQSQDLAYNVKQANALSVDWGNLFPKVVKEGNGFDLIIGNPPYIKLDSVPSYKDTLKADKEIYYNQGDLTHHFILRSLQLLKPSGTLGYIIARYFLEAKKADKIRNYVKKHSILKYLIDLGPYKVFGAINTRSLILVASNSSRIPRKSPVQCGTIDNWNGRIGNLIETLERAISQNIALKKEGIRIFPLFQDSIAFTGSRWLIVPQELLNIKEKILKHALPLDSICEVGKGMESGFNKAYTVLQDKAKGLEQAVLRKRPQTKDIRRYLIRDSPDYFIFPELIDSPAKFPSAISHLEAFKHSLDSRHKKPKRWFDYSAPQNKALFMKNEKILVPYTSVSNRFALDTQKRIGMTDVYCIAMKNGSRENNSQNHRVDIRWILGILNSRVAEFYYLSFIAKRKKGEFEYLTSMGEIPIPRLALSNARDKELHDLIVKGVNKIIHLMEEWDKRTGDGKDVGELERRIFGLEKQIDSLVYEQYRLNAEERALIDSYFKCNDPEAYFRLLDKFEPRMHI
ncbi:MAG: Eco57I restriction-modification methylase domain-containing protein [Candidatus Thorarchaeota archaeon]